MTGAVLTFNAGSSSIKVASFDRDGAAYPASAADGNWRPAWSATAESLGTDREATLLVRDAAGVALHRDSLGPRATQALALERLLARRDLFAGGRQVTGIGHRIVHGGMAHAAPTLVDDALVDDLVALEPLAPLHQQHNVAGVRAARAAFIDVPQVACFDTAFHVAQPEVNRRFALPRAQHDAGIRRYGFHGLSYESIVAALPGLDPRLAEGKVVIAHLGNGASLCAVAAGRSVATTMSFSPLDGLTMGTRCGQLDASVVLYLLRSGRMSVDRIEALLFKESGLLGLSGLSSDMRELAASPAPEAKLAVDHFVEQVVQQIGRMTAALRGMDALVFTGGIGENAAPLRLRVIESLAWTGIRIDHEANAAQRARIDGEGSKIAAYVVATDEEATIARHVVRALARR